MTSSDLTAVKRSRSAFGVEPVAAVPEPVAAGHEFEDGRTRRDVAHDDRRGQHRVRHRLPAGLAVPAAGARRAVLHHSDRDRPRSGVRPHGRRATTCSKHILSTTVIATAGFVIGSLLGAALGYVLGMSVLVEKVLSPYLLGLQIAPKVAFAPLFIMWLGYNAWPKFHRHRAGGILPDPGECAAIDEDRRPRPDQSGARLQYEPACRSSGRSRCRRRCRR